MDVGHAGQLAEKKGGSEAPGLGPGRETVEPEATDQPIVFSGMEPNLANICTKLEKDGDLTLAAHLKGSYKQEWHPPSLVLTFDQPLRGQVGILQEESKLLRLREIMNELFGPGCSMTFELGEDPKRLDYEEKERAMHEEVENHPIVQLTKEIFHGKIRSIKKGGKP